MRNMEHKAKRIHTIFYKNTWVKKSNQYTWCGVVDKNGRMLKNQLLDEAVDFFTHLYEITQVASDMLIDYSMYKLGVHNHMKRFFKLVSPTLWESYLLPVHRDRGRYKAENIYLFHDFYDAYYNTETFFKGVLWMITSLENLMNNVPFIDKIRILRVNHDFVELFGEENLEVWSFDDIVSGVFEQYDTIESAESKKLKEIAAAKSKVKIETTKEIADNGMILIKTNEEEKKKRKSDLPDIYDYGFVCYKRMAQDEPITEAARKRKNTFKKASPEERTLNRSRLNLVLR